MVCDPHLENEQVRRDPILNGQGLGPKTEGTSVIAKERCRDLYLHVFLTLRVSLLSRKLHFMGVRRGKSIAPP